MALKDELDQIGAQIRELEKRQEAIYKASLAAPESEKVCPDWCAETLAGGHRGVFIEYPITLHGITHKQGRLVLDAGPSKSKVPGAWVAIRPVGEEHKGETFLGVYLGDLATEASASFHRETGVLAVGLAHWNPAIWVPDMKRIVFGYESWWGVLKSPDDLRKITNEDIDNIWYVKALRALSGAGASKETTP
jgi:hypothetical protein